MNIVQQIASKFAVINPRRANNLCGVMLGEILFDRYEYACREMFQGTEEQWKLLKMSGKLYFNGTRVYKNTDPCFAFSIILLYARNTLQPKN